MCLCVAMTLIAAIIRYIRLNTEPQHMLCSFPGPACCRFKSRRSYAIISVVDTTLVEDVVQCGMYKQFAQDRFPRGLRDQTCSLVLLRFFQMKATRGVPYEPIYLRLWGYFVSLCYIRLCLVLFLCLPTRLFPKSWREKASSSLDCLPTLLSQIHGGKSPLVAQTLSP